MHRPSLSVALALLAALLALPLLAKPFVTSDLFNKDVVVGLRPLPKAAPEVRIYTAN